MAVIQMEATELATPSQSARIPSPTNDSPSLNPQPTIPPASSLPTPSSTLALPASGLTPSPSVWAELRHNPRLLLVVIFACFGGLLFGYDTGIIGGVTSLDDFRNQFNIALPNADGTDTQTTANTVSWIVSSFLLGCAASAIVTGPAADVISRKWTIFVGAIIFTIGGALQGSAYGLPQLIIGRVVAGLAVGALSTIIPVYNAELSSPEVRGVMNTLFQLAITLGILLAFLLNLGFKTLHPYGWRLSLSIQSAFSIILVLGCTLLPESPRWFMIKRREAEAKAVLSRLRREQPVDPVMAKKAIIEAALGAGMDESIDDNGNRITTFNAPVERTEENAADFNIVKIPHTTVEQEIEEMRASILHQERIGESSWADIFSTPLRVRVALGCGIQGWQQLTGINSIFYYSTTIFANVGVNSLVTTAITGIINVVATFLALPLIDRVGRVPLLVYGSIGMTVCALIIAIVAMFGTSGNYGICIIVFACLYIVNFAFSWGPCGWLVPSEIYPLSVRGKAVSLTTAVNWLGNFAISEATPHLLSAAGVGPTFFLFFGLLLFITIFVFLMLPETKGVTLEKMDRIFAIRTLSQFMQYMKNNVHHCFAVLFLVNDYDQKLLDAQREANYSENKKTEDAQQMVAWKKEHQVTKGTVTNV